MRLDKFICHVTGWSRQHVQRVVRAGDILVNDKQNKKPDYRLLATDQVKLDGKILELPKPRYFMLNKPVGYVCANHDSEYPVVLDCFREDRKDQLQIAGRLDVDTTGLVLVTDDGVWNHRVTAPSSLCKKTYVVMLYEPLTEMAMLQLRTGVLLAGEKKLTHPAELGLSHKEPKQIRLSIHEGKYHQVKRMLAAVGNHVVSLHRESIGNIVLDPSLAPGEYRQLSTDEVAGIQ